jgi:hypothetical protein
MKTGALRPPTPVPPGGSANGGSAASEWQRERAQLPRRTACTGPYGCQEPDPTRQWKLPSTFPAGPHRIWSGCALPLNGSPQERRHWTRCAVWTPDLGGHLTSNQMAIKRNLYTYGYVINCLGDILDRLKRVASGLPRQMPRQSGSKLPIQSLNCDPCAAGGGGARARG